MLGQGKEGLIGQRRGFSWAESFLSFVRPITLIYELGWALWTGLFFFFFFFFLLPLVNKIINIREQ